MTYFAVTTPQSGTGLKAAIPMPPTTPSTETTSMKTRSHGETDSMDDFIINKKPRRQSQLASTKKVGSGGHVTKNQKMLNRAATAPGQTRVSDFYYIDPNNINNENYSPDLVMSGAKEIPVCIVTSNDSYENEGPVNVSSPASHTQVFEHPDLSPIHFDDECIVTVDSSSLS